MEEDENRRRMRERERELGESAKEVEIIAKRESWRLGKAKLPQRGNR